MTTPTTQTTAQPMSQRMLWLSVVAVLIADQFTVRMSSFRLSDVWAWRYWANSIVSACFLFGLIVLLGGTLARMNERGKRVFVQLMLVANLLEFAFLLTLQVNHFLIYQKPFSSFSVRFVFENPLLFLELAQDQVDIMQSILRVIPSVLPLFLLLVWFSRSSVPSLTMRLTGGLSLLTSLALATFAWASSPTMQHSLLSASVAFTDLLRMPDNFYNTEVPGRRKFSDLSCIIDAPGVQKPSVIWVVGESVVASRMSLYGYKRNTTDFLRSEWQAGRLIRFNNAVSIGTVTRVSVPYLFFGMQGPDKNGRLYRSPSVFDYAKSVGLKTAFIGAQELRWGNQDKIIINNNVDLYKSGTDFDRNAGVSKGAEDFKVLNEGAIPYLKSIKEPFFMALHMDGSHYPYASHSLPMYKKFLPEQTPNDGNSYDNTLVQLDAYLRELMGVVRAQHPSAWVFYSSDHGQNLGSEARFNSGYSEDVIRNPLFVFPPAGRGDALEQNAGAVVSQADLFATTLQLWGCESPKNNRRDSLSLFAEIPTDRLRMVAGYMSSHFVDETVAIVLPNRKKIEIDYAKGAVTLNSGQVVPLSTWQSPARLFLERFERSSRPTNHTEK